MAADFKMSGDHEAVTSVVSSAAADHHGAIDPQLAKAVDTASTGVFHQHQSGHAPRVDRMVIDTPHLFARQDGMAHDGYFPSVIGR